MQLIGDHSALKGLLVLFIFAILCTTIASAGLSASGVLYQGTVEKGSTIYHTITLKVGDTDTETNISVEVLGLGDSLDGSVIAIPVAEDTSPYSARSFITLDKDSVLVKPGTPGTVTAKIVVPANVGAGGRYAMISVHTAAQGSGTVGISTGINVPILLTIAKTELTKTGTLTNTEVIEGSPGAPTNVVTTLKNTGNYHYQFIDSVTVMDGNGTVIFSGSKNASSSIFPTYSVRVKVPIGKELQVGTYTYTSSMSLLDGTFLEEKTGSFEVKKPYVPPFAETSITVTPQSPATLAASDGSIVINFPQGALLDSTKVTLIPVVMDNLPQAPDKAALGGTAFSVEGITGLLAKDATITVKYSADDLATANGDTSKLMLARWDVGGNQWVLMPTRINMTAGTLTYETNRLSLWAVMVSEGAVPTGTKTPGFTVGIALGALAVLFIANRWRRR